MPNSALGSTALPTWDWHLNQLQCCNEDQWHPASQHFMIHPLLRFIIQLFSLHFLYVLPSSQTQHTVKQTSFALPHVSPPVFISRSAAGCPVLFSDLSWQDSFHNVFLSPLLLKLFFLIFLTCVLSDFLKIKLFSNSLSSPCHTCLQQLHFP